MTAIRDIPQSSWNRWTGSQRRIGLTGGIATGKSTVARLLEDEHIPILDADVYAKEALVSGSSRYQSVIDRYGECVQTINPHTGEASINRSALGSIVFNSSKERRWLEELIHPCVLQRILEELDVLSAAPIVIVVIPLLFEAGLEDLCSEIWLVDCNPEEQLARLIDRDNISLAEAEARIRAQLPMQTKRMLSDLVLDNSEDCQANLSLKLQVLNALECTSREVNQGNT